MKNRLLKVIFGIWCAVAIAVLLLPLIRTPYGGPGAEIAFVMYFICLPVSFVISILLNAISYGTLIPESGPWHILLTWAAFFIPTLVGWLTVIWLFDRKQQLAHYSTRTRRRAG